MKRIAWTLAALALGVPSYGLIIIGGLSNFDVYNDRPDDSCGFEVELHGIDNGEVYHTYDYSAFGAPTVIQEAGLTRAATPGASPRADTPTSAFRWRVSRRPGRSSTSGSIRPRSSPIRRFPFGKTFRPTSRSWSTFPAASKRFAT